MNYSKWVGLAKHLLAVTALVTSTASLGRGEEAELLTDRPDFTETSFVVGRGRLQVEGGFTWTQANDIGVFNAPEALFRIGLTDRLELRVGAPDVVNFELPSGDRKTQLGDSYLGAKIQLGPHGAPYGFALIPAVTLPVGGDELSSGEVDPEIVFTWSRDLNTAWSLGGIVGYAHSGDEGTTFPTVSLARALGQRVGTFLEWAAEFVDREDAHLIHHGYTFALGPNAQLDLHGGGGLTDAAPDLFIGAGFAIRR